MAEHQVLFCPFCRDSFEQRNTCPEHDIALVSFDKLPPNLLDPDQVEPPVHDDSELATFDPRFGRLSVAAGAVLNVFALVLDLLGGVRGSAGLRTHELAITAPSLWTLPLVSFTLLYVLRRRRTPRALRTLRVLVPSLAFVSPLTVLWVLVRLSQGAAIWVTGGRTIGMSLGPAVYAVGIASLLVFTGGLKLGVLPRPDDA